ncbi:hypothetical protein F5B20DRAFT_586930 [Whalleya microplaca]|nr:hypothetical protein F5B20DRAFT_586930 [Whalleya microplaca]
MCQDLIQCTFKCGHMRLLWAGPSRFCLFYPHTEAEFHSANTIYQACDGVCHECEIVAAARNSGLNGKARHEHVRLTYEKSDESFQRTRAQYHKTLAAKVLDDVVGQPEKIAALNAKLQRQVHYFLRRPLGGASKGLLLDTILRVPDILDRKTCVTILASHAGVLYVGATRREVEKWEKGMLRSKARKAGLLRAFDDGFPQDAIEVQNKPRTQPNPNPNPNPKRHVKGNETRNVQGNTKANAKGQNQGNATRNQQGSSKGNRQGNGQGSTKANPKANPKANGKGTMTSNTQESVAGGAQRNTKPNVKADPNANPKANVKETVPGNVKANGAK